jgi:hypothetical protein
LNEKEALSAATPLSTANDMGLYTCFDAASVSEAVQFYSPSGSRKYTSHDDAFWASLDIASLLKVKTHL